jgi:hypothetical protein
MLFAKMSDIPPDLWEFFETADGQALTDVFADIPSEPLKEKHYAAYPTKLARRCIRLGSSEKGQCPHCGSPWRRVTERTRKRRRRPNDLTKRAGAAGTGNHCGNTVAGVEVRQLGWEPSCGCPAHEPVPQTILDPFCGSGSTGVASRGAGRHFVGVELSPEYAALSRRRIGAVCPLLDAAAKAVSAQRSLFDLSPESPEPREGS